MIEWNDALEIGTIYEVIKDCPRSDCRISSTVTVLGTYDRDQNLPKGQTRSIAIHLGCVSCSKNWAGVLEEETGIVMQEIE